MRLPKNDHRTFTLLLIGDVCVRNHEAFADAEQAATFGCDVAAPLLFEDGTIEVVVLNIYTNEAVLNRKVTV